MKNDQVKASIHGLSFKSRSYFCLLILFFSIGLRPNVFSQHYTIEDTFTLQTISPFLVVAEDSSQSFSPEAILADTSGSQYEFNLFDRQALKTGSVYWAKISISSEVDLRNWWILFNEERDYVFSGWERGNGYVDIWEYQDGSILNHHRTGANVPAREKAIPKDFNISKVPFSISKGERKNLLIRVEGNSFIFKPSLEIALAKPKKWLKGYGFLSETDFDGYWTFSSLVLGAFLMTFLYHLILFIYLKEPVYGWFTTWLIGPIIASSMSHPTGLISEHLISNYPLLRPYFWISGTLLVWITFWQFGRLFIGTKIKYPRLDRLIRILIFVLTLNLVGAILASVISGNTIINLAPFYLGILALTNLVGVGISVYLILQKDALSRYFGGGSLIANIGVIIGAFWTTEVLYLPFDPFITAILLQLFIYSFGLAYRRQMSLKEKAITEKKLLKSEQQRANQLEEVNQVIHRFVPSSFIKAIGKESLLDVQLTDQVSKEVTVFFSDIRGFTSRSEQRGAEENFRFVRDYVRVVEPIIRQHGGFVHQFIGDGLMAIFDQSPADALRAANEMQAAIRREFPNISVGMGMHTGSLVMGIIGNEDRMDPAIISDTVNTASRMEGLTKVFGSKILLSERSFQALHETSGFELRYLGKVQVKGRANALGIYESLDGLDPKTQSSIKKGKRAFEEGIQAYQIQNFDEAIQHFQQALSSQYEDPAAQRFLRKAKAYKEQGVPEGWTGVEKMDYK